MEKLKNDPQSHLPENIRQMIDLVSAVIRRINDKRLDNAPIRSLCMDGLKGGQTT